MTKTIRYALGHSQAGAILLACQREKVSDIILGQDSNRLVDKLHTKYPQKNNKYELIKHDNTSTNYLFKLLAFLEGKIQDLSSLPIHIKDDATAWQDKVWQELRNIPYGTTTTYSKVAKSMDIENYNNYARAVGSACATNDIAILVPCHRVIAANPDAKPYYRWGTNWKEYLLNLEQGDNN